MSMAEPFLPHPGRHETIAAADAGRGAPDPAPGFGIEGEEPGTASPAGEADGATPGTTSDEDTPFVPPDPDEVRRTP